MVAKLPKNLFLSLVYHDIFDYPLKDSELVLWPMADAKTGNFIIEKTGGYHHLPGKSHLVMIRKVREKASGKKLVLASKATKILSSIPTIQFIGITGSLAMRNAREDSDIDLSIITKKNTLWITRIMVLLLAKAWGFPVRHAEQHPRNNSFCFNLWMDENHLSVPHNMRNIYTAHEVLQVVPLINKDGTFEKFLKANEWAKEYWPKAARITNYDLGFMKEKFLKSYFLNLTSYILQILEPLAYRFQLFYMRRHRTRELIKPGQAFFHPIDWGEMVIGEFEKRVKRYMPNFDGKQVHFLTFLMG